MLRRLYEYKLGFMPHMHHEQTGEFKSLVEYGWEVRN